VHLQRQDDLDMPTGGESPAVLNQNMGDDGTKLLEGILAELKNIGGQLREQETRLNVIERKKNIYPKISSGDQAVCAIFHLLTHVY